MFSMIASDSPTVAMSLRRALSAHGHDCPITHVVGLDRVEDLLQAAAEPVDLLIVVLPDDPARALAAVRRLRFQTTARLVAVGHAADPKHILETLHAGADDFLDEDDDISGQVAASLDRLAVQPGVSQSGGVVAVTSASGGSGCSTLAASLSVLLARQAGTCGLLDLSAGFGDLTALLNVTPRHTLGDLFRNHDSLDRDLLAQSFCPHDSGVRLLAAAQSLEDGEGAAPQSLERITHLSRSLFPWSVLDIDFRRGRNPALLRAARAILLVFRLDFGSLCNARRLLDYWEQHHVDFDKVVLVANRCGQASEIPAGQVPSLLGKPITFSIPEDVATANLALNCGNPAVLESPRSSLSRAIAAIADQLLGAAAGKPTSRDNGLLQRAAGILFC